ncbi:MAG: hypothetical protein JWS12_264 [Candidatus Saccharibacteria bacterium]|nr:hypothetical protein [Candidatus Saccharibacteria bacterium]
MGKMKELFTRDKQELTASRTFTESMEQRAKECAGVLIDAYFQGTDPMTGVKLSPELHAAIAPFALEQFMKQVHELAEIEMNALGGNHE